MAKMSRDKGGRGEREVAALFRSLGVGAERGCQRSGSPDSPDVKTALDDHLHVEVKRTERLSLYTALAQAGEDSGPGQLPVVLHRRNGKPWVAILNATELIELLKWRYCDA